MRPSRNAFIGYTYQEQITFLFLVMMDAKREINSLEIEADVHHNFDDIKITYDDSTIYCQIKDIDGIELSDLKFYEDEILIKNKKHSLSVDNTNLLVFKNIKIEPNTKFLGIDALKIDDLYIISLFRTECNEHIRELYGANEKRKLTIHHFFMDCLDNRVLKIKRENLPIIKVFNTQLLEETIDIGRKLLKFSNILFIEGKPGIGKSHYVNSLCHIYKKNIIYRFWISNQDKDYKNRLLYKNFLTDISKKIFNNYEERTESEIISKIQKSERVVIIDGLDHVENYNVEDLEKYVSFIDRLYLKSRVIILSRPLKFNIVWKKQILTNWNEKETRKVLDELYHIDNYRVCSEIYKLTDGYPILVRFIGEHYKKNKSIPSIEKLENVDDYYHQIIQNVEIKTALSLFLTSRSFFMKSEFSLFLGEELSEIVIEFIEAYPYLFEIRLNRISLFHDSFNKYLRELNLNFSARKRIVNQIVYDSIIKEDMRFMSRFSYFDLENSMKLGIIRKFTCIKLFQRVAENCIDFEALRSFYKQIREALAYISYADLEIINYYDLSLISNIVIRDQVSTLNGFLYTYTKSLFFNGYTIEDITSSEYLFGMLYYIQENDATLLYNTTSNDLYGTTRFLEQLENDIYEEETFFELDSKPIKLKRELDYYLKDDFNWREYLTDILTNLYIYKSTDEPLQELQNCIDTFIDLDKNEGIEILENIFLKKGLEEIRYPHWVLNDVKKKLFALGKLPKSNPYLKLSLKEYITQYSSIGSFDMWVNILSYLRLKLEMKVQFDISGIGHFWCMYYKRKDYTVINIEEGLKVFEENNLMDEETSISTIVYTQSMSEKGIRHLLADYISIHEPKIVEKIIDNYYLDDLNITWFNLPPKHINAFPDKLFNYAENKLLTSHRSTRGIEFRELKNVFYSTKWLNLLETMKLFKYRVRIPEGSIEIESLEEYGIIVSAYKEDSYGVKNEEYSFENRITSSEDIDYIINNKLDVVRVSGFLDDNYAALADTDIYQIYSKDEISNNLQEILYNAILGKVDRINSFGNLFHFVGNVPKLINEYGKKSDVKKLYESFQTFMGLSLLTESK